MKSIIIAALIIIAPLNGTILSRSTFEAWEGSLDWNVNTGGNGAVVKEWEDLDNNYQTQSHGRWSMQTYDPDDNSYANAYKTFSNSSSEYIVEFYLWIYQSHATIDSFPLCAFYDTASGQKTDIALVIDTLNNPPNGGLFTIHVEDADSVHHNEVHIDSTDRWYKFQIHRYLSGSDTVVTLYVNGVSINTFTPMNKDKVSNMISLGTMQADSLANGEVFYDDIIVSTPPLGDHPRLLFDDDDLPTLRARKNSETYTYLGIKYKEIWAKLDSFADHFMDETDTIVWKKDGPTDTLCDTFEYPYEQFTFLPRNDTIEFWLGPQRRVASELLTLSFVALIDTTANTIRGHAEGLLVSLSHWQIWNDPYFRAGWKEYIQLGVGHYMFSIALAYDWLYDYLSNYEKLSIQNTLINLGINQTYLEAIYGAWGRYSDKWPNGSAVMIGGMGIGCLALDGCDLTSEIDIAETRIGALLNDSTVCDPAGGFAEGVSYAGYAVDHLVTFCEANNSLGSYATGDKFLGNYPDWRIWCMLPGTEQYYTKQYCEPTYWDVTFCDYDHRGGIWSTAIARIADETNDSAARWFLKRRKDLDFYGKDYAQNRKFSRWDIYLPFGLFLWTEAGDTSKPNPDTLLRVFNDVGWTIARTGWEDDDYLLALKSGPWFRNHNHHEQGSFIFGGNGRWLIADMGYAKKKSYVNAEYHNVLYEPNSEDLYWCPHTMTAYSSPDSTYCYMQTIGETSTSRINPWQRKILFFNQLGSFAVMDYAEESQAVDNIYWQIHSWDEPDTSENGKEITLSYCNGPNLRGYVAFPSGVSTSYHTFDSIHYSEKNGNDTTYYFQRIRVGLPTEDVDTFRVVVGFAPYASSDSVAVTPIAGINFQGTKLKNENGIGAVIFGMNDSTIGGKYEVAVADSFLNIVCNLVPDTNYLVIKKKGADDETVDTLQTNDVGVLSFKLNGTGNWEVIITLARTTSSIKINNDSTYCNMPFVGLNLTMTNPLDSQSVDSMRIWQKYLVPPETWDYDSTGWIPYDSTYFWLLCQGEGTNVVYAQFMADGWNESAEYCDTIIFDKIAPTGSFTINDDSTFCNSSDVTMKNSLNDSLSGVAQMRFGNKDLENLIVNSDFDSSGTWEHDTAIYHDTLKLFEIPISPAGSYFYQVIPKAILTDFDNDTLLLWIDLVSNDFAGVGKVKFMYIYGVPTDSINPRGQHPCADSIFIPQGTNAQVAQYNLATFFIYHPTPPPGKFLLEARVGVYVDAGAGNTGSLFIDNLRLDVVSPYRDYSKFVPYDATEDWMLDSGNGVRKVYGQFADGAGNETTVLWDSIIADTTKPEAAISSPDKDQVLSGNVGITGYAFDCADPVQHFKEYSLYYQDLESQEEEWYGVHPDSIFDDPVNPTIPPQDLAKWETKQVTEYHGDGWYYLRLTVSDSASNCRGDTVLVYIRNDREEKGEIAGFSNDVYGLAAEDEIFIGELGTGKIYRYDNIYQLLDTFALVDSIGIGLPLAMALDDSGKLWVTNIISHYVNRFTPQGNLLLQFAGGFSLPSGIALDETCNEWVSDRLHHKIKKFDDQGNLLFQFGTRGSDPGEIDRPIGVAYSNGEIYIADSRNRRISIFDTLGNFIRVIGDSAWLVMPFGIVVDTTGCVFVSDAVGNQVVEFGPSGNRLFGIDSILDSPTGLALSSDARTLYISDSRNRRVLAYAVREEPPLGGGGPQAMGEVDISTLTFDIFPCPFSSRLTIKLQGMAGNRLTLKFYDVTGRLIKTFFDNDLVKYDQNIIWDGQDDQQRKCAAGVYFLRLEIGDYSDTKKTILTK